MGTPLSAPRDHQQIKLVAGPRNQRYLHKQASRKPDSRNGTGLSVIALSHLKAVAVVKMQARSPSSRALGSGLMGYEPRTERGNIGGAISRGQTPLTFTIYTKRGSRSSKGIMKTDVTCFQICFQLPCGFNCVPGAKGCKDFLVKLGLRRRSQTGLQIDLRKRAGSIWPRQGNRQEALMPTLRSAI